MRQSLGRRIFHPGFTQLERYLGTASGMGLGRSAALGCCGPPTDKKTVNEYLDCSSINYELKFGFGGQIYDEERNYTLDGACAAAYTDCSCLFHNAISYPGYMNFYEKPINICSYNLWWDAFNVNTITWSNCSSGACSKNGDAENPITYYEYQYVGYAGASCTGCK